MKITLKMISEEAGVSMTTVSNVINNKSARVSKETADHIRDIIKKYNYVPNLTARSLATNSSRLIGVLYNQIDLDLRFSDPFVGEFLDGFSKEATQKNFYTFIHPLTSINEVEELQRQWLFAGFVAIGFNGSRATDLAQSVKHPIVFVDAYFEGQTDENCFVVRTDDYKAGYDATQYLIDNGHQKIAFLGYTFNHSISNVISERYRGFNEAYTAFKKDVESGNSNQLYNEFQFELIKEAIKQEEITALIVSADNLAIRLINYLKTADSYQNISIISFDNIEFASIVDPPLTTISLFQSEKGAQALNILAEKIDEDLTADKITQLEGQLVERKTVCKLNE